jgi:Zn-dependent M28 family amino/carboxypeptidase
MRTILAAAVLLSLAGAAHAAVPRSELIDAVRMLDDVRALSADDMQGRQVGTPGGALARAYVTKRFEETGIRPFAGTYEQAFTFQSRDGASVQGVNVVGFVPGTSEDAGWIVITAHYDHLGIRKGETFNGADDDASGVGAILALAERLKTRPLKHGVIFVAFDGEEAGDRGSQAFVKAPPVPLASMVLDVNLDMVSRNARGELYASGLAHYPYLRPYVEGAAVEGLSLKFGHDAPEPRDQDWTWQSDHHAFHEAGVPYVYFGVEDHPDYHRPTDDFDRIDPVFYVRAVETVARAVEVLDGNLDTVVKAEKAAGRE